jgi:putative DNA primase/helicase
MKVPEFSEEAMALQAVQKYGADLRYVSDIRDWLHWTGALWAVDRKNKIFSLAREICREFAAHGAEDPKTAELARGMASAHTRAAVVSLMSNDTRISPDSLGSLLLARWGLEC